MKAYQPNKSTSQPRSRGPFRVPPLPRFSHPVFLRISHTQTVPAFGSASQAGAITLRMCLQSPRVVENCHCPSQDKPSRTDAIFNCSPALNTHPSLMKKTNKDHAAYYPAPSFFEVQETSPYSVKPLPDTTQYPNSNKTTSRSFCGLPLCTRHAGGIRHD
jgi:hypothetical protein